MSDFFQSVHYLNIILLRREVNCPTCNSCNLRPFRYGLGSEGGCVISSNSVKLHCNSCGRTFLTDEEINEIYHKSTTLAFEEKYLMDEILLNNDDPSSDYTRRLALQQIKDEKNLSILRLALDDHLQAALTSQISKLAS